jgi:hypothetical protein
MPQTPSDNTVEELKRKLRQKKAKEELFRRRFFELDEESQKIQNMSDAELEELANEDTEEQL